MFNMPNFMKACILLIILRNSPIILVLRDFIKGFYMKKHSRAYEQYCWVLQKNIVFEETTFHNGTSALRCTHLSECDRSGGCRNGILYALFSGEQCMIEEEK